MTTERTEWIRDLGRFSEVAAPWDLLAAAEPAPFAFHAWFDAWWRAFADGRSLAICVLWRGEELAGAFPLCRRGRRLEAMANVHSPSFRPLSVDGGALRALVEAVLATGVGELVVQALPADDPSLAVLGDVSRRRGRVHMCVLDFTAPIVETSGDWGGYRRERKGWQSDVERRRRRLEERHEVEWVLIDSPVDLERPLQLGLEVEASGWKGAAGSAIIASPDTELFYRSVARAYHASGRLALSWIVADGQMIAFELSLLHADRVWQLKGGYHEDWRGMAPGMLVQLALVKRCFELGLEADEILGNTQPWKQRFATTEREHWAFRSYRMRPMPLARFAYHRATRPLLKKALQRARSLRSDS